MAGSPATRCDASRHGPARLPSLGPEVVGPPSPRHRPNLGGDLLSQGEECARHGGHDWPVARSRRRLVERRPPEGELRAILAEDSPPRVEDHAAALAGVEAHDDDDNLVLEGPSDRSPPRERDDPVARNAGADLLGEDPGNYVRGIFLECCALGLTVMVLITIVGVPLRWAFAIGVFTGASNVIPYMGFAAALLGGLAYALLAENVRPLIPLVTAETFAIWVVAAVALAELLKNVLYGPIVLGGSVKLHPLVVVIGVVVGATLFGPAGMFLAIPSITVVKVLVASSARHLKAYGLV